MTNSLQEQLIKSGLVSESKLKSQRKPNKNRRKKNHTKNARRHDHAAAPPAKAEQPLTRPDPQQAKLVRRKIREILRATQCNDANADLAYHFQRQNLVKRLYVTNKQHSALINGILMIVPFGEKHYLVPITLRDELQQLDPNVQCIVHQSQPSSTDADDDHPVPDDLMW